MKIPLHLTTHKIELQHRLSDMQDMIRRIPWMPPPIKKSSANCYTHSPFKDNIELVEMPKKFNFPSLKLYDGTTNPDDYVPQYRQRMFKTTIPRDLREAFMCKILDPV